METPFGFLKRRSLAILTTKNGRDLRLPRPAKKPPLNKTGSLHRESGSTLDLFLIVGKGNPITLQI